MSADKCSIRREVLSRRDLISNKLRKAKDERIRETLVELPEFKSASKILLYASFRSEVGTVELLKYCLTDGKTTAIPKVDMQNNELRLYEIRDMGELSIGYVGIPEPDVSEDRRMKVEEMDLIIVPGSAFDKRGSRLGYGKGFYDKLLTRAMCKIIALSYEEQVVEFIPSESHDLKVDRIVTEKRIIDCHEY